MNTITPEALTLRDIVASMTNFANVADSCEITQGHIPTAIRAWVGMLEDLAARQPMGQPRVSAYRFIQKGQALQHTVWLDGDAGETYVQAERDGVGRIERAYSAPPAQPQAPAAAVPEGWVLVPINCSLEMMEAGEKALSDSGVDSPMYDDAESCWKAMLAAAPAPGVDP